METHGAWALGAREFSLSRWMFGLQLCHLLAMWTSGNLSGLPFLFSHYEC